jgi:hypothetical protein
MEATVSVYWMAFYLIILATAILLVRLFFLYSEYVRLNASHLPRKTEAIPVNSEQDSAKNEAEKALRKKSKPVKKSAKKKPAKKSKKKKG